MKSYKSGDKINFGKYKGFTVDRVSQVNPEYLEWAYKEKIIDKETITRHHRGELSNDNIPRGYGKIF